MSNMEEALQQWLLQELPQHPNIQYHSGLELTALSGDAGFRCYFRLNTQPTLLAVAAPKTEGVSESAAYFARLSQQLITQGIPAPQIIACNAPQNFLLIEDFGEQTFLDVLTDDSADLLYSEAIMVLLRMQQIPRANVTLVDYDRALLRREMALMPEWFLEQLLGYKLSSAEEQLLGETFSLLEDKALEQPQVLVHRDYHSRNLLYRDGEAPGVIDFQDAVWGPISYDVVSLLRDCYICWSPEQVKRWMMTYANLAMQLGIMPMTTEARWQEWFDWMGLQRHLKVLGIFARLALRDGKGNYLKDLPLVWHYTQQVVRQYPVLSEFYLWCQQTLQPRIEQQSWFQVVAET